MGVKKLRFYNENCQNYGSIEGRGSKMTLVSIKVILNKTTLRRLEQSDAVPPLMTRWYIYLINMTRSI